MVKYIHKDSDQILEYNQPLNEDVVGSTLSDFYQGKYILLSDEIIERIEEFISSHPDANISDVANEFLTDPIQYLHKSSDNIPLEFDCELDSLLYPIGYSYQDYTLNKYIKISDDMISFMEKHHNATAREIIELCMDDERRKTAEEIEQELNEAKIKKNHEIDVYDSSDNVNSFFIGDNTYWLDKATRVGLVNSTNMEIEVGRETTTLILGNEVFTYPCTMVIQMLAAVEVYAKDCYNVTQRHKNTVNGFTDKNEVKSYDYTGGYPEKLRFDK